MTGMTKKLGDPITSTGNEIEQFDVKPVNKSGRSPLYTPREKIHPKRVQGFYRTLKWWIMAITLGIYYFTPWLPWDRGPYAPDQAVLIDMVNQRFYFFFIEIWPQEFFYIAGLLVMAGIGLFLVTSVLGRAWCGYACPQTVWVDLFLVIERFFEGDRNARLKLDAAPASLSKLRKRTLKHITWLLISVCTGGAWVFYFADAPDLFLALFTGEASSVAYATVGILTATTYLLGGFMREQVCTYMCPWPRIQAAMFDEDSLTVTYNDWRGEPRQGHLKKQSDEERDKNGDCIDCKACVAVCPMGIDIRDGQQLECISCSLCIDACDTVMEKVGREKGLISYATWADYNFNKKNRNQPGFIPSRVNLSTFLRLRVLLYLTIYCLIGFALIFALLSRSDWEVDLEHGRNPLYVQLSDGSIRNSYEVKIRNKLAQPRRFRLSVEGLEGAVLKSGGSVQETGTYLAFEAMPNQTSANRFFVIASRQNTSGEASRFHFLTEETTGDKAGTLDFRRIEARFEQP